MTICGDVGMQGDADIGVSMVGDVGVGAGRVGIVEEPRAS